MGKLSNYLMLVLNNQTTMLTVDETEVDCFDNKTLEIRRNFLNIRTPPQTQYWFFSRCYFSALNYVDLGAHAVTAALSKVPKVKHEELVFGNVGQNPARQLVAL